MEQIEQLKIKLGMAIDDNSKDELFNLYLDDAMDEILIMTNLDVLPESLLKVQVDLAIVYYNKQGIEGQTAHSEGGISRSFGNDIPNNLKKKILSFRRLPR